MFIENKGMVEFLINLPAQQKWLLKTAQSHEQNNFLMGMERDRWREIERDLTSMFRKETCRILRQFKYKALQFIHVFIFFYTIYPPHCISWMLIVLILLSWIICSLVNRFKKFNFFWQRRFYKLQITWNPIANIREGLWKKRQEFMCMSLPVEKYYKIPSRKRYDILSVIKSLSKPSSKTNCSIAAPIIPFCHRVSNSMTST